MSDFVEYTDATVEVIEEPEVYELRGKRYTLEEARRWIREECPSGCIDLWIDNREAEFDAIGLTFTASEVVRHLCEDDEIRERISDFCSEDQDFADFGFKPIEEGE
jgi:hypothetical protein